MRNGGCSGGCLSFIAGIVLIGLTLLVIKWFGIPLGLALAVLGFTQFRRFDTDPEGFDRTARSLGLQSEHLRWATIGGVVVGVMLIISSTILWFVPSDDAPRTTDNTASERAERADPTLGGTYLKGPDGLNLCDQPGRFGAAIRREKYECRNAAPRYD